MRKKRGAYPRVRDRQHSCLYGRPNEAAESQSLVPPGGQLILGVLELLLDSPAIAFELAAFQPSELGPRLLELGGRATGVDLAQVNRIVDEHERPVRVDLEKPRPGRQLDLLAAGKMNAGKARFEQRLERHMPGQHPDLARLARDDDHLGLAVED